MSALLQGIRVLDFGRYIAGPYCAALLAEYGADVIRIEKRDGSEDRFPAPVGGGAGALFLQMNRNKRSITLDPASPEGRKVVARMVKTADVVIANLPGHAELDGPGLRHAALVPAGHHLRHQHRLWPGGADEQQRRLRQRRQAMSGASYMTGEPDQPTATPRPGSISAPRCTAPSAPWPR
jgi:crotonobetainyl-CoA:carnitine CoA-transferase CaiB-like acyl-CoA transferase